MSRTGAFLFGALGGILPLLVTLATIDLAPIIDHRDVLSFGNYCGYGIKVLVLIVLGGIVALLNSEVKQPLALVQLGVAAPALITSFINGATGKPSADQHVSFSIVTVAHAQDGSSSSPLKEIKVAGFWNDVGAGITTRLDNLAVQKLGAPPPIPQVPSNPQAPVIVNPNAPDRPFWVDTGTSADWAGRDVASTTGSIPKYGVSDKALCDQSGLVAVCWNNRQGGYPVGVPTDVVGQPSQWCTYKNPTVQISTPADGRAPAGRVYLCARSASQR